MSESRLRCSPRAAGNATTEPQKLSRSVCGVVEPFAMGADSQTEKLSFCGQEVGRQ